MEIQYATVALHGELTDRFAQLLSRRSARRIHRRRRYGARHADRRSRRGR